MKENPSYSSQYFFFSEVGDGFTNRFSAETNLRHLPIAVSHKDLLYSQRN